MPQVNTREKRKLERKAGFPVLPNPMPTDCEVLLDLMDDASAFASSGDAATAPSFDHGMRLFNQIKAHYDLRVAQELVAAHHGLKGATSALRLATWLLAGVTILLFVMELWKLARGG